MPKVANFFYQPCVEKDTNLFSNKQILQNIIFKFVNSIGDGLIYTQ